MCRPRARYEDRGGGEADHGHRHVQKEHPTPPVIGEQPATEDGPDGQGDEVSGRPHTNGLRPLLLAEQHGERRKCHDDDAGTGDAKHDSRRDELADRPRIRARRGARSEEGERAEHHLLSPVAVAEQPERQHRRGEDEQIAGREPLQVGLGRMQCLGERGEGDTKHRAVEADGQDGKCDASEGPPPPWISLSHDSYLEIRVT